MNVKPISSTYPIKQTKREMKQPDKNNPRPSNIQLVEQALVAARPWGLEAEVMWSALTMAAEANEHGLTMEDVLDAALGEWDVKSKDYMAGYMNQYADPDHPLNKHDEGQMYNMNEQDVNENSAGGGAHAKMKRHRGLEIGEDGSVNGLI